TKFKLHHLFVFISDHGHSSYKNRDSWEKGYFHIPLLFYGDVIRDEFKGTVCNKIGSQVDLASTLLHQSGLKSKSFEWSKNLLNPISTGFAFYAFEVGFGWVCSEGDFVYEHNLNKFPINNLPANKKDSIIKAGKSYLQQVYQEYWDY
ncbi:MAG: sulfatase, partial [Bacteroidetes bacterium]|nr:sulfatase [Bacteroidota bacterium]